ncbi:MAG: hypothetical protein RLZ75_1869, partial [Pseudomonadota bacterium]
QGKQRDLAKIIDQGKINNQSIKRAYLYEL